MISFLTGLSEVWIDFSPLTDVLTSLGILFVCEIIFELTRGERL